MCYQLNIIVNLYKLNEQITPKLIWLFFMKSNFNYAED